jgi:anaerobic selenocysteine-containing dehydrogenase
VSSEVGVVSVAGSVGESTTHLSVCPLDCPDTCSLQVTVRAGKLETVDAAPFEQSMNPMTAGFICSKVKKHALRVHGPHRVMTPLLRTGSKGSGEFRSASWDEALDVIVDRLRAIVTTSGPSAVLPYLYNSSVGVVGSEFGDQVCARLGFAAVDHTICAATNAVAREAVLHGLPSADPRDIAHSKFIVVWGANPTISNTHLPPYVTDAVKQHGATVVVIDPRRTAMAARADHHLALRPGTDVVLAAAMARHLHVNDLLDAPFLAAHATGVDAFLAGCDEWTLEQAADVTGVPASVIATVAEQWAATRPAMLRLGWGLERNRNGGSGIATALSLPLLMGHVGERGAGILHSTGGIFGAGLASGAESNTARRHISQNDLGVVLNTPDTSQRIDALIVQGANPAVMNLDQSAIVAGLSRDDLFCVVHDQVMTDTARYADVVLPATTHFEAADARAPYGSVVMQRWDAVIDRVGESRTNSELFRAIGERFGLRDLPDDAALLATVASAEPVGTVLSEGSLVQFVDVFPTSTDRRVTLPVPEYVPLDVPDDALVLLSPANAKTINSMFGERAGEPALTMNPADAARRDIATGDRVRVRGADGSLDLDVVVSDEIRAGSVAVPKGSWFAAFGSQNRSVNVLIPRAVEPWAGGACFNDAVVRVERLTR